MTNQQILEKVIAKAIKGGWIDGELCTVSPNGLEIDLSGILLPSKYIIFNHDFAKALWPNPPGFNDKNQYHKGGRGIVDVQKADIWSYHLQQMVIADDPIKYLGENV